MSQARTLFDALKQHLMEDIHPSRAICALLENCQEPLFAPLLRMKATKQSPVHHPEGSVWNHTMLVVDEAAQVRARSKNPAAFMWAALLHDIGKPDTTRTRKGRITSYNHEKVGAELARSFLTAFHEDTALIDAVCALVRYHMQVLFVTKDLPFADIPGMLEQADKEEVALLGLCDRLGRLHVNRAEEESTCFYRGVKAARRLHGTAPDAKGPVV